VETASFQDPMSQYSSSERNLPEAASDAPVQLGELNVSERSALADEPGAALAFPAEDRGQSLAEMARRDLDAALQLLADRAQYITGASGAAIALRHVGEHDMLCRASAGTNAPELGALLSAEFGLSGESVRTRQPLRCDDAETDGRVNRESCRELGIASVAVVPVVSDDEVLGVFELFSGQANAFGDRDLVALQRLAEMVETAARFARAAGVPGLAGEAARLNLETSEDFAVEALSEKWRDAGAEEVSEPPISTVAPVAESSESAPFESRISLEHAPVLKPRLWSASAVAKDAADGANGESIVNVGDVPAAIRGLRKCEACGFPVSEGRKLCLDCDEKEWRGRNRSSGPARRDSPRLEEQTSASPVPAGSPKKPDAAADPVTDDKELKIVARDVENSPAQIPVLTGDAPIFSAVADSPSWLAANKYVLLAIVVVALAIGAVLLSR
jgi:GAF domain-containing protein